ncbi:hypothetical protein C7S16_6737 [Burkholderia thailandensis]|uniref:Uncharacterized protein n=1 Tax=Burkholderia thailandensis TaxID=57975 RepID=A0AAW9CLL7_BURTH|nr:hypothetical protein [Burkholderia thailandensis]
MTAGAMRAFDRVRAALPNADERLRPAAAPDSARRRRPDRARSRIGPCAIAVARMRR